MKYLLRRNPKTIELFNYINSPQEKVSFETNQITSQKALSAPYFLTMFEMSSQGAIIINSTIHFSKQYLCLTAVVIALLISMNAIKKLEITNLSYFHFHSKQLIIVLKFEHQVLSRKKELLIMNRRELNLFRAISVIIKLIFILRVQDYLSKCSTSHLSWL